MEEMLWIYRPILAGKCTIEGVISGIVTIDHLMQLNALLDMSGAYEQYSHYMSEKKAGKK